MRASSHMPGRGIATGRCCPQCVRSGDSASQMPSTRENDPGIGRVNAR